MVFGESDQAISLREPVCKLQQQPGPETLLLFEADLQHELRQGEGRVERDRCPQLTLRLLKGELAEKLFRAEVMRVCLEVVRREIRHFRARVDLLDGLAQVSADAFRDAVDHRRDRVLVRPLFLGGDEIPVLCRVQHLQVERVPRASDRLGREHDDPVEHRVVPGRPARPCGADTRRTRHSHTRQRYLVLTIGREAELLLHRHAGIGRVDEEQVDVGIGVAGGGYFYLDQHDRVVFRTSMHGEPECSSCGRRHGTQNRRAPGPSPPGCALERMDELFH